MFFSIKKLKNSFKYALKGLFYLFKTEQSFRVQVLIGIIIIILFFFFKISIEFKIFLLLCIFLVLSAETINTVIERILDVIEPRYDVKIGYIKDMMAFYVLLVCIVVIVIALMILFR